MRYIVKKRKAEREAKSKNSSGISSKVNNSSLNNSKQASSKPSPFLDVKHPQVKTTFHNVKPQLAIQTKMNLSPLPTADDKKGRESSSSFRSSLIETPGIEKMI